MRFRDNFIAITGLYGGNRAMKLNKKLRKKTREFLLENQKINYSNIPLLIKKPSGIISEDIVQKSKLISNDAYLMLKRERFLFL